MDDLYGYSRQGSTVWRSLRDGDFEEEDVWAVLKERQDYSPKVGQSMESTISAKRHLPSAARMIPQATSASAVAAATSSDSSSSCHEANGIRQQSAPVNIPNWSKISGKKSKKASFKNSSWLDDDHDDNDGIVDDHDDNDGIVDDCGDSDDADDNDDDDDEYNSKVPPHEILSRRLARSQISSFSVFEGVGRKLKGRDLSKVRNAVLTKTGFLE